MSDQDRRISAHFEEEWRTLSRDRVVVLEEYVVPNADILIGIPCYKDGPMVDRCLQSLLAHRVQLLIVDNAAPLDVKEGIAGRGIVIRNAVNHYVNPAWNQIMKMFLDRGTYDLLVIANSDLVLDQGWSARLRAFRASSPQEQIVYGIDRPRRRSSLGSFFAMTKQAVQASYPIPDDLLVMGGDDFIFGVCRGVGIRESIAATVTMTHVERGTYDKSPEIWDVAARDTDRWNHYVAKELVPRRIREFLAKC